MLEDNIGKQIDESSGMIMLREQAGKPPQEEIDGFMREDFPSLRAGIMKFCVEDKEEVLNTLGNQKRSQEKRLGRSLSRPSLCVSFLERVVIMPFVDEAKKSYDAGDVEKFRFLFDVFKVGTEFPMLRILEAEVELSGRGEDINTRVVSNESEKSNISVGQEVDFYLQLKRMGSKSLKLLIKDPSGISLIDDCVDRVRIGSYPDESSWHSNDFALAGVELARDLYKSLYEIAAPLYPEKQP